jgi:hypothetical protein
MVMVDHRKHNRDYFYKYTSAATAIKILESNSVRYSSPLLFNDPFDIQSGLHYDFDLNALPDKILDRMEQLVNQDANPTFLQNDEMAQAIRQMRERRPTAGFPRERMRELFRPVLVSMTQDMIVMQRQYQDKWWNDFLPRLRVFSVTEEKDNLLMWAHYAKDHTGVVFEFRVLAEQDNALCIAQPIRYRRTPPSLFTEAQHINTLFSLGVLDETQLLEYAYIKSDIWAYEKEWRVWDLEPAILDELHSTYPLYENEIGAVYFGCRIDPDLRARIIQLLASYPNAKAFQARKSADAFKLSFDAA